VLQSEGMSGASPKNAGDAFDPERERSRSPGVNQARLAASSEDASVREPAGPDPDLALVQRTQQGDRAAFRALFDKYHRRVFAVSLAVVKNPQDAHDIVQEAFVRVHRHLANFQGASSFYTWLYRITMNLSIDHHRRKKTARQVDYDDGILREDGESDAADKVGQSYAGNDPGRAHAQKELATRMQEALATLPPYHQEVIVLREVDGLSYEEISKIMKVPKGTIMSRLFHARRKMQHALSDYVAGELTPQDEREGSDDDGSR
jgi:RNA polymerase sigma-70 factor (ECF subfamily)